MVLMVFAISRRIIMQGQKLGYLIGLCSWLEKGITLPLESVSVVKAAYTWPPAIFGDSLRTFRTQAPRSYEGC